MCADPKTGRDTCAGPGKPGCQLKCGKHGDGVQLRLSGFHRTQPAPQRLIPMATDSTTPIPLDHPLLFAAAELPVSHRQGY